MADGRIVQIKSSYEATECTKYGISRTTPLKAEFLRKDLVFSKAKEKNIYILKDNN